MGVIHNLKNRLTNLKEGQTLKARAVRGGMWLGIGSGAEQALRFLRNIILARLLAPEAFGSMAIVLAIDTFFESFTEIGVKEAIVQNPGSGEETYLNGAWWVTLVRALFLYAVVFVGAPWIAGFYKNPDLASLMRVAFLSVVFKGLTSSKAYIAFKKMEFRKWILVQHGGGICGVMTAIVLAFVIQDVWALVIGFAVESFARCIFSYLVCPFKPILRFDREAVRSLLAYSRGMIGLPILAFIFMRADVFVIGKLYPISQLGLYTMAASLARMPIQFISQFAGQLMMPVFSEIQNEKGKMNHAILKVTTIIVLIGFPLLFLTVFYGKEILSIVYGYQYGAVAIPFAILFAIELLRISGGPLATFYLQTGRPRLHRLFTGMRAGIILALIYPATKWFGLAGAACAGLISMTIAYVFQTYRVKSINGLDLRKYILVFSQAFLVSLCIPIVWLLTRSYLVSPQIEIIVGVVACLVSYVIAARMFLDSKRNVGLISMLNSKKISPSKKVIAQTEKN